MFDNGKLPFEMRGRPKFDKENFNEGFAKGSLETIIFGETVWPVKYSDEEQCINFFDFAPVFHNEHNIDLRELTKSHWHEYAHDLRRLFSTKKSGWAHEKEWRILDINFSGEKEPEERIRHYPIEALSAVYFGANTPFEAKKRIYKLYKEKHHQISFFGAVLSNQGGVEFNEFEPEEE